MADLLRKCGVSKATFFKWRSKYGALVHESCDLRGPETGVRPVLQCAAATLKGCIRESIPPTRPNTASPNWASYDRALVGRGDITLWVSPEAIDTWELVGVGTRGGQRKYSDIAIETALTLRLLFHLPLRQAEGFLQSLFGMMGLELDAPDHTTISRRGQHLVDVRLDRVPPRKGLHLIVDSTGLSDRWSKASGPGRNMADGGRAVGRNFIWVLIDWW